MPLAVFRDRLPFPTAAIVAQTTAPNVNGHVVRRVVLVEVVSHLPSLHGRWGASSKGTVTPRRPRSRSAGSRDVQAPCACRRCRSTGGCQGSRSPARTPARPALNWSDVTWLPVLEAVVDRLGDDLRPGRGRRRRGELAGQRRPCRNVEAAYHAAGTGETGPAARAIRGRLRGEGSRPQRSTSCAVANPHGHGPGYRPFVLPFGVGHYRRPLLVQPEAFDERRAGAPGERILSHRFVL